MYSGGHMKRHEESCTANPNRVCRMHHNFDEKQPPMAELTMVLGDAARNPAAALEELRKVASGCPMCMLAALRISEIEKWDGDPESTPLSLGFDFKTELAAAWNTINDADTSDQGY